MDSGGRQGNKGRAIPPMCQGGIVFVWIMIDALAMGLAADPPAVWRTPQPIVLDKEGRSVTGRRGTRRIGTLPFAHGKTFATLDAYLAHRETLGAIDAPWYRCIATDRYELVTRGAPGSAVQTFTRAELAEKFGFEE